MSLLCRFYFQHECNCQNVTNLAIDWPGTITAESISIFSRPYARIIAGEPLSTIFDPVTKEFNLCYTINEALSTQQYTEIYANFKAHYPNGVEITTTFNLDVVSVNEIRNRIYVSNRPKHLWLNDPLLSEGVEEVSAAAGGGEKDTGKGLSNVGCVRMVTKTKN